MTPPKRNLAASVAARLLDQARRTFARRSTPVPAEPPVGLTADYWENPSRPPQVRAFARRANLPVPQDLGREFTELLAAFLLPVLGDLRRVAGRHGGWPPGGPWGEERLEAADP